jgi:hypothetical protein
MFLVAVGFLIGVMTANPWQAHEGEASRHDDLPPGYWVEVSPERGEVLI